MVLRSDLDSLRIKMEDLGQSVDVMRIDLMLSQEKLYSHLFPGVASDGLGNTPDDPSSYLFKSARSFSA